MTRAQKARELFFSGRNCTQAVLGAFCEDLGLDETLAMRLSCSLGGGVSRLREICGAVSGAAMVISMYYSGEDGLNRWQAYEKTQLLANEIKKLKGSIVCRELLGLRPGESQSPVPQERNTQYFLRRPCVKMITDTAAELEIMLISDGKILPLRTAPGEPARKEK